MLRNFQGGFAIFLLTVTRGGGVKHRQKMRYVICERPQSVNALTTHVFKPDLPDWTNLT
jgi:hypothetical protein